MKPSVKFIKEKMGAGRVPSKNVIAKEIQRLVHDQSEKEPRPKIAALLWVVSGDDPETLNDKAIDIIDVTLG